MTDKNRAYADVLGEFVSSDEPSYTPQEAAELADYVEALATANPEIKAVYRSLTIVKMKRVAEILRQAALRSVPVQAPPAPWPGAEVMGAAERRTAAKASDPAVRLASLSALFDAKNREYGSSYLGFGEALLALVGPTKLETADDFGRFAVLMMMVGKLHRYSHNFGRGGHEDSLNDLAVYSMMLARLDDGAK